MKKNEMLLRFVRVRHTSQELAISMSATNKTFDVAEFNRNVQQSIVLRKHSNSMSSNNNDNPIKDSYQNKHTQQRPDNEWFDYDAFVTWAKSRQVLKHNTEYIS